MMPLQLIFTADYGKEECIVSDERGITTSPQALMLNAASPVTIEAVSLSSLSAEPAELRCTIARTSGEVGWVPRQ